jgi:Ca-activated chloride channel family protein
MRFALPVALLALLAVPVVAAAYVVALHRSRRRADAFANPALRAAIAPPVPAARRYVVPALVLTSVVVLLVAAARPEARASVPRERATVMLAIDASLSMDATDIAPTRLGAARSAIGRFLGDLPEQFPVGAVAFAGTARVLSPPTDDRDALMTSLAALHPTKGTVVGDALIESIRTLRADWADAGRGPAVVLLLSDGNDTGSRVAPIDAARAAARAGVRVYSVSLGDPNGPPDARPRPPDVTVLRTIAQISKGRFYPAPSGQDLAEVWRRLGSRIATSVEYRELTFAFVAVALAIAAAAAVAGVATFRRVP